MSQESTDFSITMLAIIMLVGVVITAGYIIWDLIKWAISWI